jgi:hypothetical protein
VNEFLDDEEKMKILKDMFKENLSKSITGMKNKNNKNLQLAKAEYFEKYVNNFKENVNTNLEMFDDLRNRETLYKNTWNNTVKSLQIIK